MTKLLTGFPYPENVQLAQDVEQQIRKYGAIPATICILDGVCMVGLDSKELVQMAEGAGKKTTVKVSRRDIPYLTGLVRIRNEDPKERIIFLSDWWHRN